VAPHHTGTFLQYPALDSLPTLLRLQRTLKAKLCASIAKSDPARWEGQPYVELEKATRKEIDALLVKAGLTARGEFVTCNGFAATHRGRDGQAALNQDKAVEQLVELGVDCEAVLGVFQACTDGGEPSTWAEVRPVKGAKVRK
jgi:hypothetical protein